MRVRYDNKGNEIYVPSCETLQEMVVRENGEATDEAISARGNKRYLRCLHCGKEFSKTNYFRLSIKCPCCGKANPVAAAEKSRAKTYLDTFCN